jgi:G3E family GTPase
MQRAGRSVTYAGPTSEWLEELAREVRFDYLLVESTGISEPLPVAEPRLGRRTVLTLPLLPPPQKN